MGEEFAVGILIEPRALDVEELEAGHEAREGQGVDRELRDRLVGAGVRFAVSRGCTAPFRTCKKSM